MAFRALCVTVPFPFQEIPHIPVQYFCTLMAQHSTSKFSLEEILSILQREYDPDIGTLCRVSVVRVPTIYCLICRGQNTKPLLDRLKVTVACTSTRMPVHTGSTPLTHMHTDTRIRLHAQSHRMHYTYMRIHTLLIHIAECMAQPQRAVTGTTCASPQCPQQTLFILPTQRMLSCRICPCNLQGINVRREGEGEGRIVGEERGEGERSGDRRGEKGG